MFTLIRFDGSFNLPKHKLAQLAYRVAKCVDLFHGPELPYWLKFFRENMRAVKSATGYDQIGCADGNGLLESDFVSENIIPGSIGFVKDVTDL